MCEEPHLILTNTLHTEWSSKSLYPSHTDGNIIQHIPTWPTRKHRSYADDTVLYIPSLTQNFTGFFDLLPALWSIPRLSSVLKMFSLMGHMSDLCHTAVLPSWRRTRTARVHRSFHKHSREMSHTGHIEDPSSHNDTWGGKIHITRTVFNQFHLSLCMQTKATVILIKLLKWPSFLELIDLWEYWLASCTSYSNTGNVPTAAGLEMN